ncbi:MAG: ABC transporter substrate-binding protein [Bacillota bacterium]|jgi:peptide/nickel transport system substrate-binding protein
MGTRIVSRIFIGVMVACIVLSGCTKEVDTGGVQRLVVAVTSEADTLDPHKTISGSCNFVMREIYDPLVTKDNEGRFQPGLAESWVISDDGTTYRFTLRKDVKFTDGTQFDANAVKFTFDRLMDPETAAPAQGQVGPLESVTVIDEYTVEFKHKDPYAPFLQNLSGAYLSIICPTAVEEWGKDYGQHPVGTGPFILENWVPGSHILLVKNPDWVNIYPWSEHDGPVLIDELEIRTIKDEQTLLAAMETNEVHVAIPPRTEVSRLAKDDRFQIITDDNSATIGYLEINIKNPPMDELAVRKAVGYAINRKEIITASYYDLAKEATVPLPTGLQGYSDEIGQTYGFTHDPGKAKELLADAGFQDSDGDGIVERDGKPFEVLYLTWEDPIARKIAEVVQAQMKAVGIKVNIETYDWATLVNKQPEAKWHFEYMSWGWQDPVVISMMFKDYKDMGIYDIEEELPELFEVVYKIGVTPHPEQRVKYIHQALEMELENAIFVPLMSPYYVSCISSKVEGFKFGPFGRWSYVDCSFKTQK